MQLTEKPDTVTWPEKHYIFIEKIGPFQTNAPQAWQELQQRMPEIAALNQITGAFSLYKMDAQIYRAGVSVAARPDEVPVGLHYQHFKGGKYSRFVLTGPYSNLGPATGRTVQIVAEKNIPLREDFNIENYVNDPRSTPEDQLITEIMFPAA